MNMRVVVAIALGAGFLLVLMVLAYFVLFAGGTAPPETGPIENLPPDPTTIDTDGDGYSLAKEQQAGTSDNDPERYPGSHVWVAKTNEKIPESSRLNQLMVSVEEMKKTEVPEGAIRHESINEVRNLVFNAVTREPVPANTYLRRNQLLAADRLSALIPRYKRAVTIPITPLGSVSYLIKQGDVVDVIGNFQVRRYDGTEETLTKIVVQGATVLALDQQLTDQPPPAPEGAQGGPPQQARPEMVTLGVSPKEAETLLYAAQAAGQNNLRLALRSPLSGTGRVLTDGVNGDDIYGQINTQKPHRVEVYKGTEQSVVELNPILHKEELDLGKGGVR